MIQARTATRHALAAGLLAAVAVAAAGSANAQGTPPADITACQDAYFTARLESLLMPVRAGHSVEACITIDPAREQISRISCYASIENEMADHPELPAPYPCTGIGEASSCIRIPDVKITSAGWKPADNGQWSYCVGAQSSDEPGYRYLQIFAD